MAISSVDTGIHLSPTLPYNRRYNTIQQTQMQELGLELELGLEMKRASTCHLQYKYNRDKVRIASYQYTVVHFKLWKVGKSVI